MMERFEWIKPHLPASKPCIFVAACTIWVFCILSVSRCTFLVQQNSLVEQNLEMGLFSRAVYDEDGDLLGCVSYTDHSADFIDNMFKVGRAFGIIAALCTSIVFLFTSVSILFLPKGCEILWSAARFYSSAGCIGQMFSFFVLNSSHCQSEEHSCKLSSVGKLAVFNILFMGALTIKLFLEPQPKKPWICWYQDGMEEGTLVATYQSPSRDPRRKETLSTVDPFTAEFVASEEDDTDRDMTNNDDNEEPMLEMELEGTDHRKNKGGACAVSVGSQGSRISVQESLTSKLGIQSLKSFRLVFTCLVAIAWIASVIGVQNCTFMLVGPSEGEKSDYSALGLFSRATYYKGELIGCLAYPDEAISRFDQSFQSSRIFGTITAFLMTSVFTMSFTLLFVQIAKDEIWLVMRVLLPCATISQILVFFGYRTKTCTMTDLIECRPGGAGIMVIINIFLMVTLSIVLILVPPPPSPVFRIFGKNEVYPRQSEPPNKTKSAVNGISSTQTHSPTSPQFTNSRRPRRLMTPIPESHSKELSGGSESSFHSSTGPKKAVRIAEETETISVKVEFSGNEKKTTKTVTHADGSRTITTTIEEIDEDSSGDYDYDGSQDEETQAEEEVDEAYVEDPSLMRSEESRIPSVDFASLRQMFGG